MKAISLFFCGLVFSTVIGVANAKDSSSTWKLIKETNPTFAATYLHQRVQRIEDAVQARFDLCQLGVINCEQDDALPIYCKECDLTRNEEEIKAHAQCLEERIACLSQ